jgi:vacuolar-type H+-ATPase catalytic subunit A/Vma1
MKTEAIYILDYTGDYSEEDIDKWFEKNSSSIHEYVYDKLIEAINKGEESIKMFKLKSNDGIVKVKLGQMGYYIDKAIKYFIKQEAYEKCSILVKIKESINKLN